MKLTKIPFLLLLFFVVFLSLPETGANTVLSQTCPLETFPVTQAWAKNATVNVVVGSGFGDLKPLIMAQLGKWANAGSSGVTFVEKKPTKLKAMVDVAVEIPSYLSIGFLQQLQAGREKPMDTQPQVEDAGTHLW